MPERETPRWLRLATLGLFLAVLIPIILAAVSEGVWMAVVAFSGEAPSPSPTATPLPPSVTTTPPAIPSADSYDCPQEKLLSGKVWEEPQTEGMHVHPGNELPIPGATVSMPDLGLEAITDKQGCYSISGPPVDEPRLLTFEFSAPGFGPLTVKNELYWPGSGYSPRLERGDTPVVRDYCAWPSPPLSAATQFHARLCVETGVAPNYLMLDCPLPERHQSGPPVAAIVGSVVDAVSGRPIAGATVTIEEYREARVTGEDGCFLFDPLPLPTPELRTLSVPFATLDVTAPGHRTLVLKHLWLEGRAVDIELEAGSETQTVDYCVFSSPPQEPREKVLAERCREEGVLVLTDP